MLGRPAREGCPGVNTQVEWQSHHNYSGLKVNGAMLILIECKLVIIFSAIVIIIRFLLPVVIIIDTGQHWLTQLGVLAHDISAHGKVFHTVAAMSPRW